VTATVPRSQYICELAKTAYNASENTTAVLQGSFAAQYSLAEGIAGAITTIADSHECKYNL